MDTYDYKARSKNGELLRGSIESPSPQAVAQWLMSTDAFPISIKVRPGEMAQPEWFKAVFGEETVKPVDLLMFTRQMGNMVRAGLPMMDSIEGIQRSTSSRALSKVLQALRDDLDKGSELSAAMARHPKVFDDYYVSMVRVGESSGQLGGVFQSLYRQIEFDRQMRRKVKSALRYPTFVLFAVAVAISILTVFVLPIFAKTYAGLKVELPLLTRVLLAVSGFAVAYWWVVLIGVAVGYGLFTLYVRSPEGRYRWDSLKLHIPIVGPIIVKATIARFCDSFATASRSGVPVVQVFQLVARVVDNAYYERQVLQMRQGVERGEVLSRVMRSSGIFTPLELQSISVAEATGDVDTAIEQIAALYQEEVEYDVARLSQSVEPILLGVMGVLVGVLLLGIFMPMWEMGQATFSKMRH